MEIGETELFRWMIVFESEGECPHLKFMLGYEMPDHERVHHWLDDDLERHTEVDESRALAAVMLPDWMTAEEARAWVQSRPEELDAFFDEEWHRHMDLLDQHFGGTAWAEAKDVGE